MLLPVLNVWKLHMQMPRKFAVIGHFLLGGVTTVTGIIRVNFLNCGFASLKHPLFNDVSCRCF